MSQNTRSIQWFFAWTLVFSLSYGQAPLYYSNQNQYFLHGLAQGGFAYLDRDWLARTADPTPLFSYLVQATYQWAHPVFFYGYYALLQGVYFASLAGLFIYVAGKEFTPRLLLSFQVAVLVLHAAVLRWASYHLLKLDYPWYFQAGVAGQYVLGAALQPSTFGVLLLLSLWLYVRGRPYWAVAAGCAAAIMHATYLLSAGMLTAGYLWTLYRQSRHGQSTLIGCLALVLVLPVVVYVGVMFAPTTPEEFAQAQEILVRNRIPHHCLTRLWLDPIAAAQIGWFLLALFLIRGSELFPVLGLTFVSTAALTVIQVITGTNTLALLFPWRTSTFLIPAATAIILGRIVLAAAQWLDRKSTEWLGGALAIAVAAAGVVLMSLRQGFNSSPEEVEMLQFVRDTKTDGDTYLIPVRVPDLVASTYGSLSSDFKPAAAKKTDARLIPVDLQRFRLATGAPIFVDFKSIPYRDTDVIEWRDRLERNQRYYDYACSGRLHEVREQLQREGITHLVTTADKEVAGPAAQLKHEDKNYKVYRLE